MKEYESNGYVEINIANEFVNDSSMQLRDDYRNDLGTLYNANIVSDYRFLTEADVVASKVNQFCDENTNGMIREIVDESTVRESTAIVLNALYFKGDWEVPFAPNNVREDVFYGTSGEETATMMSGSGSTYFEDQEGNVGFSKPYVGGQFEFVGILPSETICDENGNFDVSDIDIEQLLASRTSEYEVDYKMPKFRAETTLNLVEPLSETVLAPTIGTNANYDGISETKIYVTDIIQKVVVDVNETGTEASAVTVIISKTTSINQPTPKYVALDRPFLFLIYDKVNNEILFMGKMTTLQ
jgi:serpin B